MEKLQGHGVGRAGSGREGVAVVLLGLLVVRGRALAVVHALKVLLRLTVPQRVVARRGRHVGHVGHVRHERAQLGVHRVGALVQDGARQLQRQVVGRVGRVGRQAGRVGRQPGRQRARAREQRRQAVGARHVLGRQRRHSPALRLVFVSLSKCPTLLRTPDAR